ncbi:MAG: metal-sensing transcriptional repressor [Lachnospiraceae bacterium]|nr:metal-sensing transcriptional repressor [Lachnospiraceae bacterium]
MAEDIKKDSPCECCRIKEREESEYKDLITRLNRIEGQVRGVKGMVEKDAYCVDILTQVAAISAALNSFNRVLLSNHIKTCVVNDIKSDKPDAVEELVKIVQKLMR